MKTDEEVMEVIREYIPASFNSLVLVRPREGIQKAGMRAFMLVFPNPLPKADGSPGDEIGGVKVPIVFHNLELLRASNLDAIVQSRTFCACLSLCEWFAKACREGRVLPEAIDSTPATR